MRWLWSFVVVVIVLIAALLIGTAVMSWAANSPGKLETGVITRVKYWRVGGKDWRNPVPDSPEAQRQGADHFQHHCEICHGLDGQGTGVPFANKMSPPAPDLASARVQAYTDGQLKWIVQNGIRFTGMPGWNGILDENEMWLVVRYLRHLPPKGSLGVPKVYQEAEEEHEHPTTGEPSPAPHQHGHPEH